MHTKKSVKNTRLFTFFLWKSVKSSLYIGKTDNMQKTLVFIGQVEKASVEAEGFSVSSRRGLKYVCQDKHTFYTQKCVF